MCVTPLIAGSLIVRMSFCVFYGFAISLAQRNGRKKQCRYRDDAYAYQLTQRKMRTPRSSASADSLVKHAHFLALRSLYA